MTSADSLLFESTSFPFKPAKSLHIISQGLHSFSGSSELQTKIESDDGTLEYVSVRQKKSSNDCILADQRGIERISTTYLSKPWRDPVLARLNIAESELTGDGHDVAQIKNSSKWMSRSHTFTLSNGQKYMWAYERDQEFTGEGKITSAIVLSHRDTPVAALIRNKALTSSGIAKSTSEDGGNLLLGQSVGDGVGLADEAFVIASCLVMLQLEVNRSRA